MGLECLGPTSMQFLWYYAIECLSESYIQWICKIIILEPQFYTTVGMSLAESDIYWYYLRWCYFLILQYFVHGPNTL